MLESPVKEMQYSAPIKYSKDLEFVWNESSDNKGAGKKAGNDRISAEEFKKNLHSNLDKIRKQLNSNTYKIQPLKAFFIDKGNGKERVICIPTVQDRLVQRLIAYQLKQKYNYKKNQRVDKLGVCNDLSFGIDDGHIDAIDEALKRRESYPWVLKTDIKAFFDSIDRNKIIQKIKGKLDKKSSLIPLLEQVVSCEISSKQWHKEKERLEKQGLRKGKGLRQGMPLSPLLSNFFLGEFDFAMSRKKINAIRYADDLIVFCNSREKCEEAEKFIKSELAKLALEIPDIKDSTKTFIKSPEEPVLFLGVELKNEKNYYIKSIPQTTINKVIEEQNKYKDINFCIGENLTFHDVVTTLKNKSVGYKSSYKGTKNLDKFLNEYNDKGYKIIEDLLVSILGNKIHSLEEKQRKFLGLSIDRKSIK